MDKHIKIAGNISDEDKQKFIDAGYQVEIVSELNGEPYEGHPIILDEPRISTPDHGFFDSNNSYLDYKIIPIHLDPDYMDEPQIPKSERVYAKDKKFIQQYLRDNGRNMGVEYDLIVDGKSDLNYRRRQIVLQLIDNPKI